MNNTVKQLLEADLAPHYRRLEAEFISAIIAQFDIFFVAHKKIYPSATVLQVLSLFLAERINSDSARIVRLKKEFDDFTKRYSRSASPDEQQEHILNYSAQLGASAQQVEADRKAFSRWFGSDAMSDRFLNLVSHTERGMAFYMQRLGCIASKALQESNEPASLWSTFALEKTLLPLFYHDGDQRIRAEAFKCLAVALRSLPSSMQANSINDSTQQYVYHAALDYRQQTWIQCEAINLLSTLSLEVFTKTIEKRLNNLRDGDDLFVRRRAILLLGDTLTRSPALSSLLDIVIHDTSPFVRQALAETLLQADHETILRLYPQLLLNDKTPQVRAAAAHLLPKLILQDALFDQVKLWLSQLLQQETDPFAMKITLNTVSACLLSDVLLQTPERACQWTEHFTPLVETVHLNFLSLPVRRFAAMMRERLWCFSLPQRAQLAMQLQQHLAQCPPGKSVKLPRGFINNANINEAGRVLSVVCQRDFGADIERTLFGWRIWRGHVLRFRLWRLIHEFRHPSPDKRQAFNHTIGRVFYGNHRAPSSILSELAETKVPGEPLHFGTEAGWRPYVPLVDEFISAIDQNYPVKPIYIYSSEGITEIIPPRNLFKAVLAKVKLTWNFAQYARLRNWVEGSQQSPDAYLQAMQKIGFNTRFQSYAMNAEVNKAESSHLVARHSVPSHAETAATESNVQRFFPAGFALDAADLWSRIQTYFFSVFGNTILELIIFTAVAMLIFFGRHLFLNYQMRLARNAVPLVVGGWGTRGKSGTERLKAALFNALGYSVVSKTTGCEAMFLHGPAYGKLREMFLFRPYDKATIWEQFNVVRITARLKGEIFLWECMALTPSFVQLLQRKWMRDDFSTVTNTFPDHEDLQGPAGINIPEVMTNFIPHQGMLLTSEEQMLPILSVAAEKLGTPVRKITWIESGMLTDDILSRFPYQEHPDNIALVLAMAHELGIAPDFTVKEMADRVVLDLGVLKTYPVASLRSRKLEFINGMSANERFGCLGNWKRTGFADHNMQENPGHILAGVVNNRADRIARSRVFAGVIAGDIQADLFVLIGSNLKGLQGYIRESWQALSSTYSLWPAESDSAVDVLTQMAKRMRIVHTEAHAIARLESMLSGTNVLDTASICALYNQVEPLQLAIKNAQPDYADEILQFVDRDKKTLTEFNALKQQLEALPEKSTANAELDKAFRELLWLWLEQKIVVVTDYYASGNQIIDLVCRHTPPGFKNSIQGLQNIKGTGLDFVYRWQAWDTCYQACQLLQSSEPEFAQQGLSTLSSFQEYGVLCEEHVNNTVAKVKLSNTAQNERFQGGLTIIAANLDSAMQEVRAQMSSMRSTGWQEKILSIIESFMDAGDAVKRRKIAMKIYEDLIAQRISHFRAALELQQLNKDQKGGWLAVRIANFYRKSKV